MATSKKVKPRVDYTRKNRAARRKAFLDSAAKRMKMLDWGSFEKWVRECVEEPTTDQGVNNRLRLMLSSLISNLDGGDPSSPPMDIMQIRELYPVGGRAENSRDEAGRLASRPKPQQESSFLNTAMTIGSTAVTIRLIDKPSFAEWCTSKNINGNWRESFFHFIMATRSGLAIDDPAEWGNAWIEYISTFHDNQ